MRDIAERITRIKPLQTAIYWLQFLVATSVLLFPLTVYEGFLREHQYGLSTQAFGGLCQWLLIVLNVVTGNLDREGGALFPLPAVDLVALASRIGQRGGFAGRKSRVRGLPEFGRVHRVHGARGPACAIRF
jgi:hypothetical protein